MGKLKSSSGETLVETLFALLIIVLVMGFLVTAVTVAVKINAKLKAVDQGFAYDVETQYGGETIVVDGETVTVTIQENNGYYYYEESSG